MTTRSTCSLHEGRTDCRMTRTKSILLRLKRGRSPRMSALNFYRILGTAVMPLTLLCLPPLEELSLEGEARRQTTWGCSLELHGKPRSPSETRTLAFSRSFQVGRQMISRLSRPTCAGHESRTSFGSTCELETLLTCNLFNFFLKLCRRDEGVYFTV